MVKFNHIRSNSIIFIQKMSKSEQKKRRCDKTVKTSVVEAEKRMNRASIDSEVFELALRHHTARLFWDPIMRI